MSGGDFDLYLKVVVFFAVVWLSGRISGEFGISPIIGEIAAGVGLGPNALNLVPYVSVSNDKNEEEAVGHRRMLKDIYDENSLKIYHFNTTETNNTHNNTHVETAEHEEHHEESVWKLLGQFGVTLMIVESGTHIHFKVLYEVGPNALVIAIIGTFLPLVLGMAFFLIAGEDLLPSFAAGCALAPTSVGIALKLLGEANQLNSIPGQTIVTAAFLDDIFSLILLVIVMNLGGTVGVDTILIPFISCFAFLGYGLFTASKILPKLIPWILSQVNEVSKKSYQPRDEIHLGLMVLLLMCYAWIASHIGSHLLGAFIAGMSFCEVPRSMYIWRSQMKRISNWLVRLFFAATVAFSIPVQQMFSVDAFVRGLILALIPTVLGKLFAGIFMGKWKWVIGVAMVGRGEFAYLVAESTLQEGLITDDIYAIVVWALLLAVVIGPLLFKVVLKRAFRDKVRTGIKCFEINASGQHHHNIHFEIVDTLHHLQLDVLEAEVKTDGQVDTCKFIVSCGDGDDLDNDMIAEIKHDIVEALNDPEAQVNLAPHDQDVANENKDIVEIRIMSQHHPAILPEILRLFVQLNLEVLKIHTEDHLDVDTDVFFCKQEKIKENQELVDLAVIRYGLRDIFHQHNEKCEVMVKRVGEDRVHAVQPMKKKNFTQSSDNVAHRLLDALGEGFEIKFTLDEKPKTSFLLEISFFLSDLNLDVTAVDLNIIDRFRIDDSKTTGLISTRDMLYVKGEEDQKERLLEIRKERLHEIRERLTPLICGDCDNNMLEISHINDPESKSTESKGTPPRKPRLTKRLTAIGPTGDVTNKKKISLSEIGKKPPAIQE